MKLFEKIVLVLLALLLTLSLPLTLAGCGQKEPADEQQEEENETPEQEPDYERIGTVPLEQCVIVVTGSASVAETRLAALLRKQIATVKGFDLPVCKSTSATAKNAAGKIVIGRSLCEKAKPEGSHDFAVAGNGNTFEIAANSSYGYVTAFNYLKRSVITKNRTVAINDDTAQTGHGDPLLTAEQEHGGEVRFMVNNVFGYGEAAGRNQRMQMLMDLYKTYSPDVLGLQEFHALPRGILYPLLIQAGYKEVMIDRGDDTFDNGASTPLFYKADRLELLDCGHLLYTDAPDLNAAAYRSLLGSYTMAQVKVNDYSKSITWGIFRVKETGHVFMAASTHLYWRRVNDVQDDRDDIWRQVQAAVAKETLLAARDAYLARPDVTIESMPVFVGGDMNTTTSGSTYTTLMNNAPSSSGNYTDQNAMRNTNLLLPLKQRIQYSTNHHHEGNWDDTYNVYDEPYVAARSSAYENSLDYIFVDAASAANARMTVKASAALFDPYAMLATDHCPVMIDFDLAD